MMKCIFNFRKAAVARAEQEAQCLAEDLAVCTTAFSLSLDDLAEHYKVNRIELYRIAALSFAEFVEREGRRKVK